MTDLDRRTVLAGGVALGSAFALAPNGPLEAANAGSDARPNEAEPHVVKGYGLTPAAEANPLGAKITVFTVASTDLEASLRFYRDVMGFSVLEEGAMRPGQSSAPGAEQLGGRYLLFGAQRAGHPQAPGDALERPTYGTLVQRGAATIRVVQAPTGAVAIRPRPGAQAWDPGLVVMEGGTRDPAESYHALVSARVPVISPPRYYPFRGGGMDLDPMSYAAFGPSGEQLFITATIDNTRPEWTEPGLHTTPGNCAIVSLDQRPVDAFFANAFGLRRINQLVCQQRNGNELIGAPRNANFLWGNIGEGVSIEVWEFKVFQGTVYPTALNRTGLAMMTLRVKDLDACRARCQAAGIKPVGQGALPVAGHPRPDGFTLRGAVGELIEVVAV